MTLFPTEPVIDKALSVDLFNVSFEAGLNGLRKQGMLLDTAISFYISNCLKIDWYGLWDYFEKHGYWRYFSVEYKGHKISAVDGDGGRAEMVVSGSLVSVCKEIFWWGEDDIFDGPTKVKIKTAIKKALFEVVAYLDSKIMEDE